LATRSEALATSNAGSTTWARVLWLTGTLLLVALIAHVAVLAIGGGPLTGPVSLRKPATFAETGWLTAWSVALMLPALRTRAWQRHGVGASVLLFVVGETAIMAFQAWRGVPSHYNFSTPLDAALMRGGAAGTAGIFLVGVVVLLVAALRTSDGPASVRLGLRGGIVVLLVGCAVGFVMISNNSGVFQGRFGSGFGDRTSGYLGPSPAIVGPEYLLLRPATSGGDLVLPHAIGVHGLILLAVPALLLARTRMAPMRQLLSVGVMVASVGGAMTLLLIHALRQLPLVQLHPVVLAALLLCGMALIAVYAAVSAALLRTRR
jgi:hypothetical protein